MIGVTTIVTGTYNKEKFLPDAADSVINQTRRDWRWWLILDGANHLTTEIALSLAHKDTRITLFTEKVNYQNRYKINRQSYLMNKYFPLITTDYFCWLSDDDILSPDYLETLAGALDKNPEWDIVYGICDYYYQSGKNDWTFGKKLPLNTELEYDLRPKSKKDEPCYNIDGGQILQTKKSYNLINDWQFPLYGNGGIVDGLYMNELAKQCKFHFIDKVILTHRATYLSENVRADK